MTFILFVVGLFILIKGADLLVQGASSLATRLGISALVIGLTIVSFGTSAPELIVSVLASTQGNTDIAIGNVIGSNITNILLILGISAFIYPLKVQEGTVWKEIPFALLAMVVLAFMVNDTFIDGASESVLSRIDGLLLLSFFVIFLYYIFSLIKSNPKAMPALIEEKTDETFSGLKSTLMIMAGLVGLVVGGIWIVDGAVAFAVGLGVSEALIGLTIVAIGTSLPELATSAVAAYRKNVDIAVGNIVGSNIFNVLWILGMSSVITELPFSSALMFDVAVAIGVTVLLFAIFFIGKRHVMEKWQGALFVLLYIAYIIYLIARG